jgi:topoisomerase-4 subunit A
LLNKKISKLNARISLLEILIDLTNKDNLERTNSVIKGSRDHDLVERLMGLRKMSSYQATQIKDMRMGAFTLDALDRYKKEKVEKEKELAMAMDLIRSERKIDRLISSELDDLKKYSVLKKSRIVTEENVEIPNTRHTIIITKNNLTKKLLYNPSDRKYGMGTFKVGDYPTLRVEDVSNLDNLVLFDNKGKYSVVEVHKIPGTELSQMGNKVYDYAKLEGEIVELWPQIKDGTMDSIKELLGDAYLVTLTKNGYIKRMELEAFNASGPTKGQRVMKIKDDDALVYVGIHPEKSVLIIYTERGKYSMMTGSEIPLQGKDNSGLSIGKLADDDAVAGLSVLGKGDLVVVTDKGGMKRCEADYMGSPGKRKEELSYVATVEPNAKVIYAQIHKPDAKLMVARRMGYDIYKISELPLLGRRSKCPKVIPLPVGDRIIMVSEC